MKSSDIVSYSLAYLRFFAKIGFFLFFFSCYNSNKDSSFNDKKIYVVDPFLRQKLDGTKLPEYYSNDKNISITLAKNETGYFSFLIFSRSKLENIKIDFEDLSSSYLIISKNVFDPYIVKVWYQASDNSIIAKPDEKVLTSELLVKDDSLIIVDAKKKKNYLKTFSSSEVKYYDITERHRFDFPSSGIIIKDSKTLNSFSIESDSYKQILVKINLPLEIQSGEYFSKIKVYSGQSIYDSLIVKVRVLDILLPDSDFIISIFYEGVLSEERDYGFGHKLKSPKQYEIELQDLLHAKVLYPTFKENPEKLGEAILKRKKIGFKIDRIFLTGTVNDFLAYPEKISKEQLLKKIEDYKKVIKIFAPECKDIYVYGYDEASVYNRKIYMLPEIYKAVKSKGVKIFAAISPYPGNFEIMNGILDAPILLQRSYLKDKDQWLADTLVIKQIENYKNNGAIVFSYGNPQVGIENPELFRKNYGLGLFFYGYNGCMNFAYQRQFGNSIWNDFDAPIIKNKYFYRDHVFAYPITEGIISTIQYEGFKKGITDLRYLKLLYIISEKNGKQDLLKTKLYRLKINFINSFNYDIFNDFENLKSEIIQPND